MTPTIHPRSDWTSRAPKSVTNHGWKRISIIDVHWPGSTGSIGTNRENIATALRSWQRYHMDTKGWRDIAYNVAVDLNGEVWMLRGWDALDGGTSGRNDDLTVLAIMGAKDGVSDAMKRSILWCFEEAERRKGAPLRRTHHSALVSTSCPGPALTAWSKAGFPAPQGGAGAPVSDAKAEPQSYSNPHVPLALSGRGDAQTWKALQHCLRYKHGVWGFKAPLEVDGVEGKNTWRAIQRFLNHYRKAGLVEDGLKGRASVKALQRYLGVPDDGVAGPITWKATQLALNENRF